jgi:hypothetical protein
MLTRHFGLTLILTVALSIVAAFTLLQFSHIAQGRPVQPCTSTQMAGTPFRSGCGYFTNTRLNVTRFQTGTNAFILSVGIPATTNKLSIINHIQNQLQNGTPQNQQGANFIIQTMRGGDGNNGADWNTDRPPSPAQMQDWRDRINNPAISVTVGSYSYNWVAECRPTVAGPATTRCDEDAFMLAPGTYTSVIQFWYNGSVVYAMRTNCANPVGNIRGLPASPPRDFSLNPSVTANKSAAEPGESVVVTPEVSNVGSAVSTNTQWQFSQFVVPPSGTYPGGGVSGAAPAAYYGNGLTVLDSRTGASFGVGRSVIGSPTITLPDQPVGTRVCYALSVQARSNSDGNWAHAAPVCIVIAKKPKVQIQGGDLSVGKPFVDATGSTPIARVSTGVSTKDVSGVIRTFGSWVEYGIVASGTVTGTGSGSAYAAGGQIDTATQCESKLLTFTNSPTMAGCSDASAAGSYTSSQNIPDVSSSFLLGSTTPSLGNNPTVNLTSSTVRGVVTATGNVNLTGGASPLAKGRWIVINAPEATVTITGNITYTTEILQTLSEIPQLIIIARSINIVDSVTQVDAWLIAKPTPAGVDGKINTCSSVAESAPLSSSICASPLTINGPVMAQKLLLRRTAGAGSAAATGDPAEVINLRPDAYLWASTRAINTGRIQTVQTTELPPRL